MADTYAQYIQERKPISAFLLDDNLERTFRNALRSHTPEIIEYLSSKEIIDYLIDSLINEEDRSVQEGSEALTIILGDIDVVLDNIISNENLDRLFSYLIRERHQPRRAYFFLRVMSFLFQNRTPELFSYVVNHQNVVQRLVHHIRSPHILQLLLNMLAIERQTKELSLMFGCSWSDKSELIPIIAQNLTTQPEESLESVQKFLAEICLSYPVRSSFIKNFLTCNDCVLLRTVVNMLDNRALAIDAVKMFEQLISIVHDNKNDQTFFSTLISLLISFEPRFTSLFTSESLMLTLSGVKLLQSFVRYKLCYIFGPDNPVLTLGNLMDKFPLSSILHTAIIDTFVIIIDGNYVKSFYNNNGNNNGNNGNNNGSNNGNGEHDLEAGKKQTFDEDQLLDQLFGEPCNLIDKVIDTLMTTPPDTTSQSTDDSAKKNLAQTSTDSTITSTTTTTQSTEDTATKTSEASTDTTTTPSSDEISPTSPDTPKTAQLSSDTISPTVPPQKQIAYKGHMRILANVLKNCSRDPVTLRLSQHKRWNQFLPFLEIVNDKNTSFREKKPVSVVSMASSNEIGRASLSSFGASPTSAVSTVWLSRGIRETSTQIAGSQPTSISLSIPSPRPLLSQQEQQPQELQTQQQPDNNN